MSVFISYRREGGKEVANALYEALHNEYEVYLDTEFLKNGRYDLALKDAIRDCTDFILLVTENVFDRCADPEDWISWEIGKALAEEKNIIPVFVGVSAFPGNTPESIRELRLYNAISWTDEESVIQKLKAGYLRSDRRYILTASLKGDHLELDAASEERLKELYRMFVRDDRFHVRTELRIQDRDSLVRYCAETNKYLRDKPDAEDLARQSILKTEEKFTKKFNHAVNYLLQDKTVDVLAGRLGETEFREKRQAEQSVFTDEKGIRHWYGTAFLWIEIINRMLSTFFDDPYEICVRYPDIDIECYVLQGLNGRDFSFRSIVKYEDSEQFRLFQEKIRYPLPADCLEVPIHSLVYQIYPSFFFKIGELKVRNKEKSFESDDKYSWILNIMNYSIGLA